MPSNKTAPTTILNKHQPIIKGEDLHKSYGKVTALGGVSFEVYEGEVFGMLGPNGAGKTTAIEIFETLRAPDSGNAWVGGFDVSKQPLKVKSIIGVQLQSAAFFERLKISETVALYGQAYGLRVDPMEKLELVGLAEKSKAYFRHLSGGQKQRLSIAVGLVNDPKVLFLDEPTTGLDPYARRSLWKLIKTIQKQGTTVVLTTHYMEEAEELCDRTAIMDAGRIVAMGSPSSLISDLLNKGFAPTREVKPATLEDVFLDLTGRELIGSEK